MMSRAFAVVQRDGVAGGVGRLQLHQLLDALTVREKVQPAHRPLNPGIHCALSPG